MRQKGLLVLFVLFSAAAIRAQDSHYNSQQPDSKSTLNGGTGTAGSRELSAVYFNPGIISLFDQSNLGLSGNLYSYESVKLKDANGLGEPLTGSNFQSIPSLLAGTFKWKNSDKLTSAYAYLNKGYYVNRLSSFTQEKTEINGSFINAANRYDVRTRFSEDWVGAGVSYRINEHWGVGLIPFAHFYTQQFMQRSQFQIVPTNQTETVLRLNLDFREARLFSVGLLFNLGVVYSKGEHEFGMNIITPRINIVGLSYSSIERSILSIDSSGTSSSYLFDDDFRAKMNRPLNVNLGYAWLHQNRSIKVQLSYHMAQKTYVMGRESEETIRSGLFDTPNNYDYLPVSANSNVLNIGIGYEWRVNEKLKMISGFRTDFSFFDKSQFRYIDFTTVLVYWNLYHVSFGIDWKYKWMQLNTGIDYAFSYDQGLSQFINFDEIDKPIQNISLAQSSSVSYHQIKAFVGLVLNFN